MPHMISGYSSLAQFRRRNMSKGTLWQVNGSKQAWSSVLYLRLPHPGFNFLLGGFTQSWPPRASHDVVTDHVEAKGDGKR